MKQRDIKELSLEELTGELRDLGEPAYRAKQIMKWLYEKGAASFAEMTDLPKELAAKLEKRFLVGALEILDERTSSDGTRKFLFRLGDGTAIETVLIPAKNRLTACVSTQAGCKFGCAFCASGLQGFVRDLAAAEIVDQVLAAQTAARAKVTNVVFMGVGEPFDNCSTCGIIPGIKQFARFGLPVELSVSLHAATAKLRNRLMPVGKKYPLAKLVDACRAFALARRAPVTFEYLLIRGVNDSPHDAERLAALIGGFASKINLIRFSPVTELPFEAPVDAAIDAFIDALAKRKITVTMRRSKGADIDAACGQLRAAVAGKEQPHE